jgi:hypothetical protein
VISEATASLDAQLLSVRASEQLMLSTAQCQMLTRSFDQPAGEADADVEKMMGWMEQWSRSVSRIQLLRDRRFSPLLRFHVTLSLHS